MSHDANKSTPDLHLVADLRPDPGIVRELRWFFEEAESAVELASNFLVLLDTNGQSDCDAERRIEAMHAARKIGGWLQALAPADIDVLAALYRPVGLPEALDRVLGELAILAMRSDGAIDEYRAALSSRRTRATSVAERLAERLAAGGRSALATMRRDAERMRARALRAYERVRGNGPCVAPGED